MVSGSWFMAYGLPFLVRGLWLMGYGLWIHNLSGEVIGVHSLSLTPKPQPPKTLRRDSNTEEVIKETHNLRGDVIGIHSLPLLRQDVSHNLQRQSVTRGRQKSIPQDE
jgi:hypothetical protein